MTEMPPQPPAPVLAAFDFGGAITGIERHGRGLINDTWLITTDARTTPRAILQRLNRLAFPHPEALMENLQAMLTHVHEHQAGSAGRDRGPRFPHLYPTRSGTLLVIDDHGDAWRAMSYLENTLSIERLRDSEQARAVGRTLGRFHALIGGLEISALHETRPDFHDTPRHLQRLERSLETADCRLVRIDGVRACIDFVDARRDGADILQQALAAGRIGRQVVHGDPKLDNFLFDRDSGEAVSLIDLDTIQPGLLHHDLADCLRSCCNRAGESPDSASGDVAFDLGICRAVLEGWFGEAGAAARDLQVDHLVAAIRLIPFELGVRFLADHLNGNRYFRSEYPLQNLHRATTQFRLVTDIENRQARISDLVAALA